MMPVRSIAVMLSVVTVGVLVESGRRVSEEILIQIVRGVVLSVVGYGLAVGAIPRVAPLFEKAGLFGMDINKKGTPQGSVKVPEALGLASATVSIVILCAMHFNAFRTNDPHPALVTSALASITFMTLLGFADDVLDLRWRYKMVLPLFGCLPLLAHYSGSTTILLPTFLRSPFIVAQQALDAYSTKRAESVFSVFRAALESIAERGAVELGVLFYVYMALLSIFCSNAINIYAGINGLEAGQSLVIACFIIIHNALELHPSREVESLDTLRQHHLFSIELMLPFAAVTLALLWHNAFPSRVFVGDTFCYFAGMTFAVGAILGHYPETLLVFFIPQLINFIYSLPQLIGIVHCPRHRLPRYNIETKKLEPIRSNLNLVNLTLLATGPMSERALCELLLLVQIAACCFGLAIRYAAVNYVA